MFVSSDKEVPVAVLDSDPSASIQHVTDEKPADDLVTVWAEASTVVIMTSFCYSMLWLSTATFNLWTTRSFFNNKNKMISISSLKLIIFYKTGLLQYFMAWCHDAKASQC